MGGGGRFGLRLGLLGWDGGVEWSDWGAVDVQS